MLIQRVPVLALGVLSALASMAQSHRGGLEETATPRWDAGLKVEALDVERRGGGAYRSSSRLAVEFTPAAASVHHYRIVARERSGQSMVSAVVAPGERRAILRGLASGTTYGIDITACSDAPCTSEVVTSNDRAVAGTDDETWQIQASGDSVASAFPIVADGNVKIHAIRLGPEAPESVTGRVQLYYGPLPQASKGLAIAVSDGVASSDPLSVSRFTSLAGRTGLLNPPTAAPLVTEVNTGQAVPLGRGVVRLYFEARGADGRTRIMHVDSQDGFVGRDFHQGSATVCSTASDYATGGPCAPTVDISVASDPGGNPGFTDARQFKIAYPQLDDWRSFETPGSFMVLTVSGASACTRASRTSAYALWDGSRWVVQYLRPGCPKLFENIQAPMPLHIGGGRYKMYFGNPSETTGALPESRLPFLGPKRVAYADATTSGDPNVVEFEDWEPLALARTVRFVWPSGRPLSDTETGYLDDFVMLMPTGEPGLQVMYTAMTDGRIAPFATMAILLNP